MLQVTQRFLSPILVHHRKLPHIMAQASSSIASVFTPTSGKLLDKKSVDKESFRKQVTFPAVHVDKKLVNKCRKAFKQSLVHRKKFSNIHEDPSDADSKYVLLNPAKVTDGSSLSEQESAFFVDSGLELKLCEYETELTYDNWTADEVLRRVMPSGVEVPTSFSIIGHIAHINLREEQQEFKHVIGQVLMDKNPALRTVVNKVGEINNEYRFFDMELLAGEDNMVALVREHGAAFEFDFSKVYWNSRLSTEHTRIASKLGQGDVLYDMFAGVGPFAIPAAKRKCTILANDLNPESYKWLTHNAKLNKVQNRMRTFNMDAREFARDVVKDDLITLGKKCKDDGSQFNTHVVMNLPSIAIEFLDVFCGLLKDVPDDLRPHIPIPTMHCHCFSKAEDMKLDVCNRVKEVLHCKDVDIMVHDVRDVAPNKEMFCATFRLPDDVVFAPNAKDESSVSEPDSKKQRCE